MEVLLGDSLTLSCGAHGNPRPTVVWHKDESPIEKHEKIKVIRSNRWHLQFKRNFIISIFCMSIIFDVPLKESVLLSSSMTASLSSSNFSFFLIVGTQWYLVFGLRHKKYFRSVQMSRVQHRGEPDPLYPAAGQRSVLNCQSQHVQVEQQL